MVAGPQQGARGGRRRGAERVEAGGAPPATAQAAAGRRGPRVARNEEDKARGGSRGFRGGGAAVEADGHGELGRARVSSSGAVGRGHHGDGARAARLVPGAGWGGGGR